MALVFLGEGFYPLIDKYILVLDYRLLYWVNMISAILDNATLAAAEISVEMSILQIEAILMGLIIAGGMLIPGNIPNIISASKLRIGSKEWAKIGVPFGLVVMVIFYLILF
jgi:predicted cation transporter